MAGVGREQYIEVGIESERYALRIEDVHEIIKMQAVTEIPGTRQDVKGVVNVRGNLITVISLRSRFGYPEEAYTKATRIVVVPHREGMMGIIVDCVHQVTSFSRIQPPPAQITGEDMAFFSGVGQGDAGLVCILRMDALLQHS
ncbi:chemotaxis protein CheW [Paenibacillus filicis]|uniref:Chemotaxis protein CheW n=1 Tax=Paenibacillus filicis TaxID=669464 RepID=A0ABU9DXE7_9BACL